MEEAVIVRFKGQPGDPVFALSDALDDVIQKHAVGEFDGYSFSSEGAVSLYMYGSDAEVLFQCIQPTLRSSELLQEGKGVAIIRSQNEEREVPLS